MYVSIARRASTEIDQLRVSGTTTLRLLRQSLASLDTGRSPREHGVDLADTATLARVNAALRHFLERDERAELHSRARDTSSRRDDQRVDLPMIEG